MGAFHFKDFANAFRNNHRSGKKFRRLLCDKRMICGKKLLKIRKSGVGDLHRV